jgi:hypothetical protein
MLQDDTYQTSYAGGLCALDLHMSGAPMAASLTPTGPVAHPVGALHLQHLNPSVLKNYAYGQRNTHDYWVCYSSVPGSDSGNFGHYWFRAPGANHFFGSPLTSNTPHHTSYSLCDHSTHNFYPGAFWGPLSYSYLPVKGVVHPVRLLF